MFKIQKPVLRPKRTARITLSDRQAFDLILIELSQTERAAMAAIAARKQREQLGTAFQPDPDEAG